MKQFILLIALCGLANFAFSQDETTQSVMGTVVAQNELHTMVQKAHAEIAKRTYTNAHVLNKLNNDEPIDKKKSGPKLLNDLGDKPFIRAISNIPE